MDKEAVVVAGIYLKFSSDDMTEQQALDKLEEVMMDINEKFGSDVSIHVHDRRVDDLV